DANDGPPQASAEEIAYLCEASSRYTSRAVAPADVVNTWSGVRALYDDGQANPSAVTRDYRLLVDASGPPVLSVFGGKITTHRKLAEHALEKIAPFFSEMKAAWTDQEPLPGGAMRREDVPTLIAELMAAQPALDALAARDLARRHGTLAQDIVRSGLGERLAPGLYEAEVRYLVKHEWARTAGDVLWRRTKVGLVATLAEQARVAAVVATLTPTE
ncbi:MAG: glycerol-3-phosphate dehydrogenase C-terminal domain-containing protein, partial [Burkholderiales bacterium]